MDQRVQVALYVAAAGGLISGGLWFYGSSFKRPGWSVVFGLFIFAALFVAGSSFLGAS